MKLKSAVLARKAISILAAFAAPLLFIAGCNSSTETLPDAPVEVVEERIIYQNLSDNRYYMLASDGTSELLCDINKFTGTGQLYMGFSINAKKNKIIYVNASLDTLYISNYDGSDKIRVDIDEFSFNPASALLQFAPNGEYAVYQAGVNKLYKIKLDGSAELLPEIPPYYPQKALVADRLHNISFAANSKYFTHLYSSELIVRDSLGSIRKRYTELVYIDSKISPGGDTAYSLVFDSYSWNPTLHITDLTADKDSLITPDSINVEDFAVSPDGEYIAYTVKEGVNEYSINTYNIKTGEVKHLIDNGTMNSAPVFTFGGKLVWNAGYFTLMMMNLDGSEKKTLMENALLVGVEKFKFIR